MQHFVSILDGSRFMYSDESGIEASAVQLERLSFRDMRHLAWCGLTMMANLQPTYNQVLLNRLVQEPLGIDTENNRLRKRLGIYV